MSQKYTVQTSIYTGIGSATGLSDERPGYVEINNMFDNIINLTKAKGALEKVSVRLLALNLVSGDEKKDNLYITADNYRELQSIIPEDVRNLIDITSADKTADNLLKYKEDMPGNFLYTLFYDKTSHYGYESLKKVIVRRIGNSDIIDISYTSDDPGIALNTVKLITEELSNSYEGFKYKSSNEVVAYYEEQLLTVKSRLSVLEDDLTRFNIENGIINYIEQTKAIAISYTDYENRLSEVKRDYESSTRLLKELEYQMGVRSNLLKSNAEFIAMLDTLSSSNARIAEIEMFSTEEAIENNLELKKFKEDLAGAEKKISGISDEMNRYKISKEGVAIEEMVNKWLLELIKNEKAKAELKVLKERKEQFVEQYKSYSPVGAEINKREREIRVLEKSYLEILHGLNVAKLKQKNLQLSSATLDVVSPASFPLKSDKSRRMILLLAAFFGSILFIILIYLLIELLDRTLRDTHRTKRLTSVSVMGVFTGIGGMKYNEFPEEFHRACASNMSNRIIDMMRKDSPFIMNVFSVDEGEGKSFISESLINIFTEKNIKTEYFKANEDFNSDLNYTTAKHIVSVIGRPLKDDTNIAVIEHPALNRSTIPSGLVISADLNIVIMNAERVWTESDQIYLDLLISKSDKSRLFICLNNTTGEVAESHIGQIRSLKHLSKMAYDFLNLGITSSKNSIEKK